jgi:hypothetical protein
MQDYPAAHSMDTDWFAVDADGNVGIFSSSEDGAVPSVVRGEFGIELFIERLPKDDRGILVSSTEGSLAAKDANLECLWKEIHWGGTIYDILLVLKTPESIELFRPHVLLQFSGSETVIYVQECEARQVRALVESGEILKGINSFSLLNNAHLLGVFPFKHDIDGIPAPYQKKSEPPKPLKIHELPSFLQPEVNQVRFDLIRFTEVTEIQPIEHLDCQTWDCDNYWLDTKRERPEWQEMEGDFEEEAEV